MCFSAPVSFAAAGGLTAASKVCFSRAKKGAHLLAAVPLLFGVQQLIEGAQWLFIRSGQPSLLVGYAFLVFAFILWPTYVPLAMMVRETSKLRKRLQALFLVLGMSISVLLVAVLLREPLFVDVVGRSIHYNIAVPEVGFVGVYYTAVVVGSLLLSSERFFKWLGGAVLLSAVVAGAFFTTVFVSVWCLFAAIISVSICFYIARQKS